VNPILSNNYYVYFGKDGYESLNHFIDQKKPSKIFVLVDENTNHYCLDVFKKKIDKTLDEVIQIKAGEEYKNLQTCQEIWNQLTTLGADRKSLLINLGGGVITDMGGFSASCYKRGIDFINIPTTLLSMVDASVGGKTGIDLGVLKNQIGLFSDPKMVIIDPGYLKTLSQREVRSGMAEIFKYGLTHNHSLWNQTLLFFSLNDQEVLELIRRSNVIKNKVVTADPKEGGLRKVLNYGHTLGHAIESYFLLSEKKEKLTHGEAIAVGMICEAFISEKVLNFPPEKTMRIKKDLLSIYPKIKMGHSDFEPILAYLIHDKKNTKGDINFVLLQDIEQYKIDCKVSDELNKLALEFYLN
jgi:3-dehydroquinate synthase